MMVYCGSRRLEAPIGKSTTHLCMDVDHVMAVQ